MKRVSQGSKVDMKCGEGLLRSIRNRQLPYLPLTGFSPAVGINLFGTEAIHHVPPGLGSPDLLIPHLAQQHPHLGGTQHHLVFHVDHAQHIGHAVYLIGFTRCGNTEMLPNLVFLHVGCLETAHMLGQRTDFFLVEPIRETALPEVHHLTVQPRVVQGMVVGTEDVLHLERQPAAVARDVRQEVQVVARAAERGQVRTNLLVAGIGCTLHHLRKRYRRLDLVHLLVGHAHDFFQTDQPCFGQQQTVVLVHAAAVVLRHIIVAQFGRQQEMEPGGLVDALLADEHQYLVVHTVAQESGYHTHQPLFQATVEHAPCFDGIVGQHHRSGQGSNVVGIALFPGRKAVEIVLERMVYGHKLRAEHPQHVLHAQGLPLLVDAAPQCSLVAVGHRSEPLFPILPADFGHAGNLVPTEVGQLGQRGFNLFHGNVLGLFALGLGGLLAGTFRTAGRMQLAVFVSSGSVARMDVADRAVGVVIRKPPLHPFNRLVFVHPIAVEQIARLADVLVVMPVPIGIAPSLQHQFDGLPHLCHHHLIIVYRKRFGPLPKEGVGVVTQHASPGGILHGAVEMGNAEQTAVMVIALIERLEIGLTVGHPFHAVDDAKPLSRQGDVGQQPVRVVLQEPDELFGLPILQLVDVHHGVLGVCHQVLPVPFSLEAGGRRKHPRFAPFDLVGIGIEALRTEVTVLFGVFFQGVIGNDQSIHFFQSDWCRRLVGGEGLEQRKTASHVHFLRSIRFILHV